MIISEQEKKRIRGLHKNYSIIKEGTGVEGVWSPESEEALSSYDSYEDRTNIEEDSEGEETFNYGEDEGEDRKEEEGLEHEEDMAPHDRIREIEKHLDALKKDMDYDEDHEDRGEAGTQFESVSKKKKLKEQVNLPSTTEIKTIATCIGEALNTDIPSSCVIAIMNPDPLKVASCIYEASGAIWDVISNQDNQAAVIECIPEKYQSQIGIWG